MQADIDRILISQHQLAARVAELARQITADHEADGPDAGEITIVPILTGAFIFCADLIRRMPLAMKIGLLTVSSYPGQATVTQGSKLVGQSLGDVRGRRVLLIDDILDSGGTLRLVVPALREMGASVVRTAVLLRKDRPEAMGTPVDYVGFDIPDEFVVGYGLDYGDVYRNLPDIVVLKREAIARR
jgi:hypoxanthine phosphoribosyltransferase